MLESELNELTRLYGGDRSKLKASGEQPSEDEFTEPIPQRGSKEWRDLAAQLDSAHRQLAHIYASPGWTLLLRYRRWLQAVHRKSWGRAFGAVAAGSLRRMGIGPPAAEAAPPPEVLEYDRERAYREWRTATEPSFGEMRAQRESSRAWPDRPLITVLTPVYRVAMPVLRAMIQSVLDQTYEHWEFCIVAGDPEDTPTHAYLKELAAGDPRIKVAILEKNLGISGNSNEALKLATGDFLALLDHDDTLPPFALFELARAIRANPAVDLIYSDKDHIDAAGVRRHQPLFKAPQSPDTMLTANIYTHLTALRTSRVREVGAWRPEFDGAQDWDLFLRVVGAEGRVHHIPQVLYHWRKVETSVASRGLDAKPYAGRAQIRTMEEHLARIGSRAGVTMTPKHLLQLTWPKPRQGSVSIVITPHGSPEQSVAFASKLLDKSDSEVLEALIPMTDEAPVSGGRIRLVKVDAADSLAARLNKAAGESRGETLIFLDQGVETGSGWTRELTGPLEDLGVAIVGPSLLDERSGLIRRAGIVFNRDGSLADLFSGELEHHCEAFGCAVWYRNVFAVSGACFSIRREVFHSAGRFSGDPVYPRVDVDLCLRVLEAGAGRILVNPYCRPRQVADAAIEQWIGRDAQVRAAEYIRDAFPDGDPHFSRNVDCVGGAIHLSAVPKTRTEKKHSSIAEAQFNVASFDFTAADVEASKRIHALPRTGSLKSITWFVPGFATAYYGGIHTVLRFADYFRRRGDVESRFAVVGSAHPEQVRARIAAAFPELAQRGAVLRFGADSPAESLPASDAGIATLWTTAFPLLAFQQTRAKFFMIQDYEPAFHPAGTSSAMAESTWQFGFHGICNTPTLKEMYTALGGSAEYFLPCVDTGVFHANGRGASPQGVYTVFLYGRPSHPRNCFELASEAMRILKRRMRHRVRIVSAGSEWDPREFGLEDVIENLGLLPYEQTGALYRRCDAGVAMMATAHPSYLPFELMACGALVVANRNPRTAWMLHQGENCLLGENSPSAMADAIGEGLANDNLRAKITANALRQIAADHSDWDAQAERIYRYIMANV